MKKYFLFSFLLLLDATAFAQQRIGNFIVYGKGNGLPQNAYHNVFESSNGYLWISSASGLFRFDGKRFLQINSMYYNSNSPSDNNIVDFEEDNAGNLWMAGFISGVTKYNLKTGKFRQYKRLSADSTPIYGTFCIKKDKEGTIWIGTAGRGLAKYIPEKDTFQLYYPNPSKTKDASRYGENTVSGILIDNSNSDLFWLSCFDGLYSFNKKTNAFVFYNPVYINDGVKDLYGFLSIEQAGNYIYLGTWFGGLAVFNKITTGFRRVPYNNPGRGIYHYGILDMQLVGDSLIYMACMNDGLLTYNIKSKLIKPQLVQADVALLNTDINIQNVSNTPHAGFFAGGNSAIYQSHARFNYFTTQFNYQLPKEYPAEVVGLTAMVYDKENNGYWATFLNYKGLVFYDSSFLHPQYYKSSEDVKYWFDKVVIDGNNSAWTLNYFGALYKLNKAKKIIEPASGFNGQIKIPADNRIMDMETDNNKNIWLAGNKEVYHYDVVSGKFITFKIPLQQVLSVAKNGIRTMVLKTDSHNNAWLATDVGLFNFDINNKLVSYYKDTLNKKEHLASANIKCMAIDKHDNIWLGYFNEGIQVLNSTSRKIEKAFTMQNGLPSMEVNYIDCDIDNNILICTISGMAVYKPAINAWQVINAIDGLKRDYLDVPVFGNLNGKTVLDQQGSFVVFNINTLQDNKINSPIHITSLLINGNSYEKDLLPEYLDHLSLGPGTKDIIIEFAVMNWQFPFRTKYFYRVDGIHKSGEWIKADEAKVSLTGLSSGQYTFRFYAVTNDGIKSEERTLQIEITPPWYKTWWFILLCLLTTGAILYSIYKYRINQLKKVQNIRNSISRNLHDDIGASLSNINILNELAKRNSGDKEKLAEYLEKASGDIQQTSESLSDIVWNINPHYDDMNNLFIRMRRYASDMMEGKNIAYTIVLPDEEIKIDMDKRRNLFLIFKEAVNNLAKYSNATNAGITIGVEKQQLRMEIYDNGKGFDQHEQLTGNGLSNMKQRALLCKGNLTVTSEKNKGTVIQLIMPL